MTVFNFGAPAPSALTKQANYTQTYSTASRTVTNPVAAAVSTNTVALALYGFTQAQGDQIPTAINNLVTDVANLKQIVTSLIDDEQANGLAG